jgi:hypothetical protein
MFATKSCKAWWLECAASFVGFYMKLIPSIPGIWGRGKRTDLVIIKSRSNKDNSVIGRCWWGTTKGDSNDR